MKTEQNALKGTSLRIDFQSYGVIIAELKFKSYKTQVVEQVFFRFSIKYSSILKTL